MSALVSKTSADIVVVFKAIMCRTHGYASIKVTLYPTLAIQLCDWLLWEAVLIQPYDWSKEVLPILSMWPHFVFGSGSTTFVFVWVSYNNTESQQSQ